MADALAADVLGRVARIKSDCAQQLRLLATDSTEGRADALGGFAATCDSLTAALRTRPDGDAASVVLSPQIALRYAKLLLDYTFFIENDLVDRDFPKAETEGAIRSVFDALDSARAALGVVGSPVAQPFGDESADQAKQKSRGDELSLGCSGSGLAFSDVEQQLRCQELIDCITWRKGALLYMYCHTLYYSRSGDPRPDGTTPLPTFNRSMFLQYARNAAWHLADMFPRDGTTAQEYTSQSQSALQLAVEGVNSDSHMLALMYLGELCSWYIELSPASGSQAGDEAPELGCDEGTRTTADAPDGEHLQQPPRPFCPSQLGHQALSTYITMAEGPLAGTGWNTAAAKRLLSDRFVSRCEGAL